MPELPESPPPESLPPAPFDHVVRRQMVRCLNESGDEPLPPSGLAEHLGTSVAAVAYHIQALRGRGAVELVGGSTRSGARYLFGSTVRDDPEVARLLEETLEHDEQHLPRRPLGE